MLLHVTKLFTGNVAAVYPATVTAYTVPVGYRLVLRSFAARNLSGGVAVQAYVLIDGFFVGTLILGAGSVSSGTQEWRPWIVLDPGTVVKLAVSSTPGVGCALSGSLYFI